jgi:predicted permease
MQERNHSVRGTVLLSGVGICMLGLLGILIAFQVVAPLQFAQTVTKRDVYGFPLYSTAMCVTSPSNSSLSIVFIALVVTYVCLVVFLTMWVSFWVRNAPERFQEAHLAAIAGMSMFQVFFVGIPTAAAVWNSAMPRFLVLSSLTFLLCLIILGTMFLPKIYRDRFGVEHSSSQPRVEMEQLYDVILRDKKSAQSPEAATASKSAIVDPLANQVLKPAINAGRGKKRKGIERLDDQGNPVVNSYQRSYVERVLESIQESTDEQRLEYMEVGAGNRQQADADFKVSEEFSSASKSRE